MPRDGDAAGNALREALDAARGVQRAGDGLVVVLLRGNEIAAILHEQIDAPIRSIIGAIVSALGTDHAVLIVVGSMRVSGAIIRACDVAGERLTSAGVVVAARVHVSALTEGAVAWKDLSDAAQDGILPAAHRVGPTGSFRLRRL
ncbi:hypothetical protein ACW9HH_32795 [Nocardia gipuzkoensis]